MATATTAPDGSEIMLREAKPAFEWILGRAIRKMSPKLPHGVLQAEMVLVLKTWSAGRGIVATELHVRLAPWGEIRRPLVPDVAYLSNERFATLTTEVDRDEPPLGPDIVVEVLSRGEKREYLEHKRDVYLATGTRLMLLVDRFSRTIETFEANGDHRIFAAGETLASRAFPDLTIEIAPLFAVLERR